MTGGTRGKKFDCTIEVEGGVAYKGWLEVSLLFLLSEWFYPQKLGCRFWFSGLQFLRSSVWLELEFLWLVMVVVNK